MLHCFICLYYKQYRDNYYSSLIHCFHQYNQASAKRIYVSRTNEREQVDCIYLCISIFWTLSMSFCTSLGVYILKVVHVSVDALFVVVLRDKKETNYMSYNRMEDKIISCVLLFIQCIIS